MSKKGFIPLFMHCAPDRIPLPSASTAQADTRPQNQNPSWPVARQCTSPSLPKSEPLLASPAKSKYFLPVIGHKAKHPVTKKLSLLLP